MTKTETTGGEGGNTTTERQSRGLRDGAVSGVNVVGQRGYSRLKMQMIDPWPTPSIFTSSSSSASAPAHVSDHAPSHAPSQNRLPVAVAATGILDCTVWLITEEKEVEGEYGGGFAKGGMRTTEDGVGPRGGGPGTPSGTEWNRQRMGSPPTARRADASAALADAVVELLLGIVRTPAAATMMMTAAVRSRGGVGI